MGALCPYLARILSMRWWLAMGERRSKKYPPGPIDGPKRGGGSNGNIRGKAVRPKIPPRPPKTRKWGVRHPPPVLYQHLKIVRGLFLDLIFRPKKGLSGPQKTHGRPLAPEVKLVFVFSFSFFRLCGASFRRFLGVGRVPKSWRQNKGI